MKVNSRFIAVFFIFIFIPFFAFSQETFTLMTYYPSPYGSYNDLTVFNTLGVGTTAPAARLHVVGDGTISAVFMSGKVGIGTASPDSKLNLVGGALEIGKTNELNQTVVNPIIRGSGSELIFWAPCEGYANKDMHNGGRIYTKMPIIDWNETQLVLQAGNDWNTFVANQLVLRGNGNVGIGTATPSARLQISKNDGSNGSGGLSDYGMVTTASGGQATLGAEYIGDGFANLNLGQNNGGTRRFWHISSRTSGASSPYSLEIYNYSGGFAGPLFALTTSGNVGIGAAAPAAKLHVASGLIETGSRNVKQGLTLTDSCGAPRVTSIHNGIWAPDYSSGCGDEWFIGAQDRDGVEASTLVIGMWNDADDHIGLIPSGNVGVGTVSPAAKFEVMSPAGTFNGTYAAQIQNLDNTPLHHVLSLSGLASGNTTYLIYATGGGSQQFTVSSTGQVVVTQQLHVGPGLGLSGPFSVEGLTGDGAFPFVRWDNVNAEGRFYYDSSSRRNKDKIEPWKDDFYKILKLTPKTFVYNASGNKGIGYIAEDLDEMGLKALVTYNKDKQPDTIQYDKIPVYLLEIVKDQQKELASIKKELAELKAKIK